MRSTKTTQVLTCDRCRREVSELKTLYTYSSYNEYDEDADLCPDCWTEFEQWKHNGRTEVPVAELTPWGQEIEKL